MSGHRLIPSVGDAKRLADANYLRRCVILFETECGRVGYSSYGQDKPLCQSTRRAVDQVFEDFEQQFHEEFDGTCRHCRDYDATYEGFRTADTEVNRLQG